MLSFRTNPLQLVNEKCVEHTNLIVLEALIERMPVLTQDHNFVKAKKSPMKMLEMSIKKQRSTTKTLSDGKKGVLLQSDSLTKVYELSVAKLLDSFRNSQLSEDEQRCYLVCVAAFCKY